MRSWNVVALLAITMGLACGDDGPTATQVDFVLDGQSFSPTMLSTSATKKIFVWGWNNGPHNVTFEDGATGSGDRVAGANFQRDYTGVAAGTNRFRCTLHSTDFTTGMVGSVTVVP